jgi:hypothetical protein
METIELRGRGLLGGVAEGPALVCRDPVVWAHGVEPSTGLLTYMRSPVYGQCVKGRVFVYPFGKGSTTSSTWLLETIRCGNGPAAIVNRETEIIIATGIVLGRAMYGCRIPVVDRLDKDPTTVIETGDWVRVDGSSGVVTVTKEGTRSA